MYCSERYGMGFGRGFSGVKIKGEGGCRIMCGARNKGLRHSWINNSRNRFPYIYNPTPWHITQPEPLSPRTPHSWIPTYISTVTLYVLFTWSHTVSTRSFVIFTWPYTIVHHLHLVLCFCHLPGVSVDEHGNQHFLDASIAYKRAVLNCIHYLSKFGYTKQQVHLDIRTPRYKDTSPLYDFL